MTAVHYVRPPFRSPVKRRNHPGCGKSHQTRSSREKKDYVIVYKYTEGNQSLPYNAATALSQLLVCPKPVSHGRREVEPCLNPPLLNNPSLEPELFS